MHNISNLLRQKLDRWPIRDTQLISRRGVNANNLENTKSRHHGSNRFITSIPFPLVTLKHVNGTIQKMFFHRRKNAGTRYIGTANNGIVT
mmetsp:Transcript_19983/g.35948  ORF Transcript_19983/g.35948 Transcript_19983/m.35948 type:complete len:90 (-) Transcript_19983:679-948(-)